MTREDSQNTGSVSSRYLINHILCFPASRFCSWWNVYIHSGLHFASTLNAMEIEHDSLDRFLSKTFIFRGKNMARLIKISECYVHPRYPFSLLFSLQSFYPVWSTPQALPAISLKAAMLTTQNMWRPGGTAHLNCSLGKSSYLFVLFCFSQWFLIYFVLFLWLSG